MSQRDRLGWALATVAAVLVASCTGHEGGAASSPSAAVPASDCTSAVTRAPLPTWARAGFTPPEQVTTYVQGIRGDIIGILFGQTLRSPHQRGQQNKILWVPRVGYGGGPLKIAASLTNSDVSVVRLIQGGPAQSIVDLPAAGCWRFDLTWSGHSDQLYVPYRARSS